ncbi:helix-turn-helix domain-containing protein [Spirosoma sp. KCTC 42546]|uniref:helix-turn-helix domain-containing protein n=1 Tax=Spirosoma sp. KCTC 42546 TaxID=2520506 RepID=UPI0011595B87|nr:helix-turn-helix domain-containing protein [Spirosoma sp. KCTC 42546]QDK78328.1 helix-turn-helix domain-containing protein [Spirosoma sp. KCTC 42546]
MNTERFLPVDRLRPFVKTFMIIESEQGMVNKLLPGTSIVMAFRYKGNVRYAEGTGKAPMPTAVITGLRNSLRLVDYAQQTATLLVIFNEGGASALFKESLHELFGLSAALDELIPRRTVSKLEERLAEANSNQQRVTIVEQFLLSRLHETSTDLLIRKAIQHIQLSKGTVRIHELLADLPISQDPFEKRFRRMVGTSPKQFSRIVRLRSVINQYSPAQSLTETAHQAGYFDQAHFIKDFRTFTGQVPHLFFQSGGYW